MSTLEERAAMPDLTELPDDSVETYADVLARAVEAMALPDLALAAELLRPIAGQRWSGSLRLFAGTRAPSSERMSRSVSNRTRARVFIRDRFRCTYCGGRVVPRCILVAVSDVFPEELAYHPNYARGQIHPAYWALAPEADHVVAHSGGGTSAEDNLTTLHTMCNARKADALRHELPALDRKPDAEPWDGLTSVYRRVVAAGEGSVRHHPAAYHVEWMRHLGA